MASDLDKRVQERAYEIWESEGRPEGRQQAHWQQARAEISEAQSNASGRKGGARKEKASGKAPGSTSTHKKAAEEKKPKAAAKPKPKASAKSSKTTRAGKN